MADIQLEIEGAGAIAATEALTQIEGLSVSYETEGESSKETVLATIATIIGITVGTLEIAEKLYKWVQKYRQKEADSRIEKVLLVGRNGQWVLLLNASIEEIQKVLESKE
jgi:hypothetical protein